MRKYDFPKSSKLKLIITWNTQILVLFIVDFNRISAKRLPKEKLYVYCSAVAALLDFLNVRQQL